MLFAVVQGIANFHEKAVTNTTKILHLHLLTTDATPVLCNVRVVALLLTES
jgi:hypothetical protein